MNFLSKFSKSILCAVLVAVMALTVSGCGESKPTDNPTQQTSNRVVKGEGETVFNFDVTDLEGNTTLFEIHTDKTIVGEALLELGIIEGDNSEYGLYVKRDYSLYYNPENNYEIYELPNIFEYDTNEFTYYVDTRKYL